MPEEVAKLTILVKGFENSSREVQLLKVHRAYPLFREMIVLYGIKNIIAVDMPSFAALQTAVKTAKREAWHNIGGQLMKATTVEQLKSRIKKNKINGWPQMHSAYEETGRNYAADKLGHAVAALLEIKEAGSLSTGQLAAWMKESVATQEWITGQIRRSREKDYKNPFRRMTYQNENEMNIVVGNLENNSFINQTATELEAYKTKVNKIIREWELKKK